MRDCSCVWLQHTQEVVAWEHCLAFAVRPSAGEWLYLRICVDSLNPQELTVSRYLEFKERLVGTFYHPHTPYTSKRMRNIPQLRPSYNCLSYCANPSHSIVLFPTIASKGLIMSELTQFPCILMIGCCCPIVAHVSGSMCSFKTRDTL